jgi:ribonuclease HI
VKQLNLFSFDTVESKTPGVTSGHQWKLCVDGASRNNPGPSGAGIYLTKDNAVVEKAGYFLGVKTNNEAEYFALVLGLLIARDFITASDELTIISDSQLLVRQLQGSYRVRTDGLRQLHTVAQQLMQSCKVSIMHVLRAENSEADKLANLGIDKKHSVPQDLMRKLHQYELFF